MEMDQRMKIREQAEGTEGGQKRKRGGCVPTTLKNPVSRKTAGVAERAIWQRVEKRKLASG